MIGPATPDGMPWRPPRASNVKCVACLRKFAAGTVPPPMNRGPYAGYPVCVECRDEADDYPQGYLPLL